MPARPLLLALLLPACADGTSQDKGGTVAEEAPGQIQVSPSTIDFGALALHEVARTDLVVTNTGKGPLELYDVQVDDDTLRPHWTLEGGLSGQIDPGRSTVITVVARPMDIVDPSMHLLIASDDPGDPLVDVAVSASVYGVPAIRLDPATTLSVDSVTVGESSTAMVHIANDGTDDLEITSVELLDDTGAWSVSVDPSGSTVRPQSEDGLIMLSFAPTQAMAYTNTLVVESNDPANPAVSLTVSGAGATH